MSEHHYHYQRQEAQSVKDLRCTVTSHPSCQTPHMAALTALRMLSSTLHRDLLRCLKLCVLRLVSRARPAKFRKGFEQSPTSQGEVMVATVSATRLGSPPHSISQQKKVTDGSSPTPIQGSSPSPAIKRPLKLPHVQTTLPNSDRVQIRGNVRIAGRSSIGHQF
eukprot:3266455-Amphidinium_carterae.2